MKGRTSGMVRSTEGENDFIKINGPWNWTRTTDTNPPLFQSSLCQNLDSADTVLWIIRHGRGRVSSQLRCWVPWAEMMKYRDVNISADTGSLAKHTDLRVHREGFINIHLSISFTVCFKWFYIFEASKVFQLTWPWRSVKPNDTTLHT